MSGLRVKFIPETQSPSSRDRGESEWGGDLHFASRKDQKSFVLWQFMNVMWVLPGMKMVFWRTSLLSANLYRVKMWSSLQSLKVRPETWGWFWRRARVSSAWSPAPGTASAPLTITRHLLIITRRMEWLFLLSGWRDPRAVFMSQNLSLQLSQWNCGKLIKTTSLMEAGRNWKNNFKVLLLLKAYVNKIRK